MHLNGNLPCTFQHFMTLWQKYQWWDVRPGTSSMCFDVNQWWDFGFILVKWWTESELLFLKEDENIFSTLHRQVTLDIVSVHILINSILVKWNGDPSMWSLYWDIVLYTLSCISDRISLRPNCFSVHKALPVTCEIGRNQWLLII